MSSTSDSAPSGSAPGERARWGGQLQFILTCIGFSVGLGNLWRFPGLAYENGGGAFLIPYVTCSLLFGLPCLYLEFLIGQFTQKGPGKAFRKFMPALQGLGWSMTIMAFLVGVYYNVVIVWSLVYLGKSILQQHADWATCTNWWNTHYCQSTMEDLRCSDNAALPFFYNGTCVNYDPKLTLPLFDGNTSFVTSPAQEFFERNLLRKSSGIDDLGDVNWVTFFTLIFVWCLTALSLAKGVKVIGKISYITATLPYVIITVMFFNGINLDGSDIGLDFYLRNPNWSKLAEPNTWLQAARQVCFSLAVGFGGLLSLASYNDKGHNSFRDAIVVVLCDTGMSVFGGCAVFATTGFLAKKMNKKLEDVVKDGVSLAFIAYPEAMSRMSLPSLWSALFFTMFFLLGISSQFGLTQVMCTSLCDQFEALRNKQTITVCAVCAVSWALGVIMTTGSGFYWFELFNSYVGDMSLMVVLLLELGLVIYVYGHREWFVDIRSMLGEPRWAISRVCGPSGLFIRAAWMAVTPAIIVTLLILMLIKNFKFEPVTTGDGYDMYTYPQWATYFTWVLILLPLIAIPILFIYNWRTFSAQGKPLAELFRIQPTLASYDRIRGRKEGGERRESAVSKASSARSRNNKVVPMEISKDEQDSTHF